MFDRKPISAIIKLPRWGDAHQNQRQKGHNTNGFALPHQRKSAFETAQPGRRPEARLCPGCLKYAFSFWGLVHFLTDKSGGVLSRDIQTTGIRPSQPYHRPRGELHRRRTQIPDSERFSAPSVSAMPRERATSGKALPGHVLVAPAQAVRGNDGLAPYERTISAVSPKKGELRSTSNFHHRKFHLPTLPKVTIKDSPNRRQGHKGEMDES